MKWSGEYGNRMLDCDLYRVGESNKEDEADDDEDTQNGKETCLADIMK